LVFAVNFLSFCKSKSHFAKNSNLKRHQNCNFCKFSVRQKIRIKIRAEEIDTFCRSFAPLQTEGNFSAKEKRNEKSRKSIERK